MEIQTYDYFTALPADARTLAEGYREINPFVCDIWLQKYEQHLIGDNEKALYVVAMNGDRCEMLLPLLLSRTPKLRAIKIRSMANFYTTVYTPLTSHGVSHEQLASLLVDYFRREYSKTIIFEFEPLRNLDFVQLVAKRYCEKSTSVWRKYLKHINRYESVLGDDYETYLKRRPSQLKNTIRRKKNLLTKETSSELNIYSTAKEIARRYGAFRIIYRESWKEEESYPEFINEVLQILADAGKAKLSILSVDGEPAAAQIWFKIGSGWGVFKLAYKPKYRRYSVGTLLTAGTIEHLLSKRDVTEIDFFSGDDSYKRDWVRFKREHSGLELLNKQSIMGKALSLKRNFSR